MHTLAFLLTLTITCASATELQRRGFPIRPGRVEPEPVSPVDEPTVPTYHDPDSPAPYIANGPHLGSSTSDATTPEYQPAAQPNECLRETCAELTKEVAEKVIEEMLNNLIGGPSSSTTSRLAPNGGFGTQVQPPVITGSPTRSPMPNFNVAKTMTLAQEDLALFNDEEQDMYLHDRMCFYANVEQRYASAATASSTPTRQARRQNVIDDINSQMTASASASALPSSDAAYYQSGLWDHWMPNNILSIYAPVPANGSMTTATTTCSNLGGAASITVPYIQARVSSSPTPTTNYENMVGNAGNVQARAGGSAVFAAIVALVGLISL